MRAIDFASPVPSWTTVCGEEDAAPPLRGPAPSGHPQIESLRSASTSPILRVPGRLGRSSAAGRPPGGKAGDTRRVP
jgi:hypothetical protein